MEAIDRQMASKQKRPQTAINATNISINIPAEMTNTESTKITPQ